MKQIRQFFWKVRFRLFLYTYLYIYKLYIYDNIETTYVNSIYVNIYIILFNQNIKINILSNML